jgi:hypothetical protein
MAEQRVAVNPGVVDWSGENPGIYLRDTDDGPWVTLSVFFRVVLSPFGSGHAMLVLDEPDTGKGWPDVRNFIVNDNEELTRYLIRDYVSGFPSFRDKPGLEAMSYVPLDTVTCAGDPQSEYIETVTAQDLMARMTWSETMEPMAVEVTPENSATGKHDMYSLFFEARQAKIEVNGDRLSGNVSTRQFFGKTMSTAFLAFSETWAKPQ